MKKKKFFSKDLIFYSVMLAFPILQFAVFYIGVNGRAILYSFQEIGTHGEVTMSITPLRNAFNLLTTPTMFRMVGMSLLAFVLTYFIGTSLALFFSYFIYKKLPFNKVFRVFLFLPSIISSIVLATLFKYYIESAIPAYSATFFHKVMEGLLTNPNTRFLIIILYNLLMSFGTSVLMYSNAMSGLSNEIVEAAKIDGCNQFKEFFHVVLPGIFPTITTFAITSVAAIFMNQIALFSFYGTGAPTDVQTVGYYIYVQTVNAKNNEAQYPLVSAIGLLLSMVAIPTTILTKFLLEKYGPSEK